MRCHIIQGKRNKFLNLIARKLLVNSGDFLTLTIEEISRKAQKKREEVEAIFKKLQKEKLLLTSRGRFYLTLKGLLFVLNFLEKQKGDNNGK